MHQRKFNDYKRKGEEVKKCRFIRQLASSCHGSDRLTRRIQRCVWDSGGSSSNRCCCCYMTVKRKVRPPYWTVVRILGRREDSLYSTGNRNNISMKRRKHGRGCFAMGDASGPRHAQSPNVKVVLSLLSQCIYSCLHTSCNSQDHHLSIALFVIGAKTTTNQWN
jgi:hypothetical protein